MFQVSNSGVLESLSLVVHKRAESAAEWNDGNSSGRLEAGNHADEVAHQNEEEERGQERSIALAMMADDLIALALNESLDAFENMLQRSGPVYGKARAKEKRREVPWQGRLEWGRMGAWARYLWSAARRLRGLRKYGSRFR